MADSIEVSCIRKRGGHHNPHERIEALGGVHGGKRWFMLEDDLIGELQKPDAARRWNFFTRVNEKQLGW